MKILYIARHDGHDNDDEGAIAFALRQLGHQVLCAHERRGQTFGEMLLRPSFDFMLCHKLEDLDRVKLCQVAKIPVVPWYFDLVRSIDPLIIARSKTRMEWAEEIEKYSLLNFYTDGDWVLEKPEKRRHLMQGADERVVGDAQPTVENFPPLLFMGMSNHGQKRLDHITELQAEYGEKFRVMGGGARSRKHGRELAGIIASTKIVIAPDGPSTDNYWSNRVYQVLGFGGFLLHPWCKKLTEQYSGRLDLCYYRSREELRYTLIPHYLDNPRARDEISITGLETTLHHNLYRHRCETLVEIVRNKLGVK